MCKTQESFLDIQTGNEKNPQPRNKIAIIGAGISGLVSAYLLNQDHDIAVFESNDAIGGHTHTIDVQRPYGKVAVDTGFIVFNEKTYPNFIKLIEKLKVPWQPSNMSFSVQCEKTGLIFSPSTLNALFAQRKNIFSPLFYRMLVDAVRFRRQALTRIEKHDDEMPLSTYLTKEKYSQSFIHHFIIPMGAAIWSADPKKFMKFPIRYLISFFHNHGFLNIRNQPQWRTIRGGSKNYLKPLTAQFRKKIQVGCPVKKIKRFKDGVVISLGSGHQHTFDQVIIATHSDQALEMLADPSNAEKEVLGAIAYQENQTILHTDASLMPPLKAAWASWNYRIPKQNLSRVALTYNMNQLQGLDTQELFCVTLNMPDTVAKNKQIKEMIYHHPVYDPKSLAARKRRQEINGVNRTWYCGAYWGYGFHEDGVNSALAVCKHFGKTI